jgi:hypothetical protein
MWGSSPRAGSCLRGRDRCSLFCSRSANVSSMSASPLLALLAVAPVLTVTAVAVKLSSPGPVFTEPNGSAARSSFHDAQIP